MPLFQKNVLKDYLKKQDAKSVAKAYKIFSGYFHNPHTQQNIHSSKEEQFQATFLSWLFAEVLGYTLFPNPGHNLTTEFKNEKGAQKADGAILKSSSGDVSPAGGGGTPKRDGGGLSSAGGGAEERGGGGLSGTRATHKGAPPQKALAVIELKSTKTKDLDSIRKQAFDYKANHTDCRYVITSNFEKLRFYINDAVDWLEFDLFRLSQDDFAVLYLCLQKDNLLGDLPQKIKNDSLLEEENVTKKLYKDYSQFRMEVYHDLLKRNRRNPELKELSEKSVKYTLFKKTQKLLDRFLFIFFAEDRGLIPRNMIKTINNEWKALQKMRGTQTLYQRYQIYFSDLNVGNRDQDIFAYNGGLFLPDPILDHIEIDDALLHKHTENLTTYDFESEVDVNILGHIFEHSLNEIESVNAEIEGTDFDKQKARRKKDGVFYTPKYITKYIVDNTLGKLCDEKKAELEITAEVYENAKQRSKKRIDNLQQYREWLLQLSICDPACGSGAFLNQALEFLIAEHRFIDELSAKYNKDALVLSEVENSILENNLYGVDINQESVEIAKLSLWLRTAQRGRKLTSLSHNIKCGNSLIDSVKVAGDKAFKWEKEFPKVFEKGGFDVVIGNPPYLRIQGIKDAYPELPAYYEKHYQSATGNYDIYVLFIEKSQSLINRNGSASLILPHKFLISEYGQGIREFLSELNSVSTILHFKEHLVFDVTTYTCIISIDKAEGRKELKFKQIDPKKITDGFKWEHLPTRELSGDKWHLVSKETSNLFRKLEEQPYQAEDIFSRIFTGIQTSADSIFLLEGKIDGDTFSGYSKELKENLKVEAKFMKPILKGQDVQKYEPPKNSAYVIFPYRIDEKGNAHAFTEEEITEKFPLGYNYLKLNERKLRNRENGRFNNQEWFLYGRQQGISGVEQRKIMTAEITLGTKMTFDEGVMYHSTTVYSFILKKEFESLYKFYLGILNSKLMWYYLLNTGSVLRGGYFRFKTKYLKPFPLPGYRQSDSALCEKVEQVLIVSEKKVEAITRVLNLLMEKTGVASSKKLENWPSLDFQGFLKELQKAKVKLSLEEEAEWMEYFNKQKAKVQELQAEVDRLDKEIDGMVYELYGLTEEEIEIVENS